MRRALIVVDLQNDYFPGGRMALAGVEAAAGNARKLLHLFRGMDAPIFHIQHVAKRPEAGFFLPDTAGVEIHESVAPEAGEEVVIKHFPNSFRDTALLELLKARDVEEVIVCGAMTHMCIDATTRAAFDLGFSCVLARDACATRDLEYDGDIIPATKVHGAFMAALSGPYARLVAAQEYQGLAA